MKSQNNELVRIKAATYALVCQLEANLAGHINKDKIDSQAIFALTKLVDSFVKIVQVEAILLPSKEADEMKNKLSNEDEFLIELYNKSLSKKEMAPRAGLEPATERLTAACSTTELPGNNI